jgi:DMSO reductase anchor subunit
VSEFLPLFEVVIGSLETERRSERGFENHAFAMLLLGVAAVPMALGARRGARPAMAAVAAIGVVALVIVLAVDLPSAREQGTLAESVAYEDARAEPALGFFVETLGAVLLIGAGGGMLLAGRDAAPRRGALAEGT